MNKVSSQLIRSIFAVNSRFRELTANILRIYREDNTNITGAFYGVNFPFIPSGK